MASMCRYPGESADAAFLLDSDGDAADPVEDPVGVASAPPEPLPEPDAVGRAETVTPTPRQVDEYTSYAEVRESPAQTLVRLPSMADWRLPQRPLISAGLPCWPSAAIRHAGGVAMVSWAMARTAAMTKVGAYIAMSNALYFRVYQVDDDLPERKRMKGSRKAN